MSNPYTTRTHRVGTVSRREYVHGLVCRSRTRSSPANSSRIAFRSAEFVGMLWARRLAFSSRVNMLARVTVQLFSTRWVDRPCGHISKGKNLSCPCQTIMDFGRKHFDDEFFQFQMRRLESAHHVTISKDQTPSHKGRKVECRYTRSHPVHGNRTGPSEGCSAKQDEL